MQRWWPSGVRGPLIGAGIVAAVMAAAMVLVRNASSIDPQPPPNQPVMPLAVPEEAVPEFCATLYELHGTDCAELPVVTAPGALGPANAGGPGGGTDWEAAYPGSNVWIPEGQITGRLFVLLPDATVAPPEGDQEIGRLPDGAVLYWDPTPDPATAGGQ
jgi:hypothetical protein